MNLALPVGILHLAAFTMGYWLCKGLKFNEKTARTVSIETGRLTLVTRITKQKLPSINSWLCCLLGSHMQLASFLQAKPSPALKRAVSPS